MDIFISKELGKTYHQIRINENKTINDVKGNISSSVISRFENGKSDISLTNFFTLITSLNMDILEFFEIYANNSSNNFEALFPNQWLTRKLFKIDNSMNTELADQLIIYFINKYQKSEKIEDKLCAVIVKAIKLDVLNNNEFLSIKDSKIIENYLVNKSQWYIFDWHLFINTIANLNKESLNILYNKMLTMSFSLRKQNYDVSLLSQALFNMAVVFTNQKDYERANELIKILKSLNIPEDFLFTRINIYILDNVVKAKLYHEPQAKQNLKDILNFTQHLIPDFTKKERAWLKTINSI